LIEPRDPLIVRDGRPFDNTPGSRARSLAFPLPSTLAGGVRTRAGLDAQGRFAGDVDLLLKHSLRGPLLVVAGREAVEFFAPAPADAMMMDGARVHRLRPRRLQDGEMANVGDGLMPVFLGPEVKGKPQGMPAYWSWARYERWLLEPADLSVTPWDIGIPGPVREYRTHVAIERGSLTAKEGALFQTSGLEFTWVPREGRLRDGRRLALAVETDAPIRAGVAPLAGERRLVCWRAGLPFPACPADLADRVAGTGACRLVLLTPAYFEARGYLPQWICNATDGVLVKVKAAAVNRAVVISGWNLKTSRPKPTRRLAPAGSVYFLKLDGEESLIRAWVQRFWLRNFSDDEQSRRDGFGLAAVGVWEGEE